MFYRFCLLSCVSALLVGCGVPVKEAGLSETSDQALRLQIAERLESRIEFVAFSLLGSFPIQSAEISSAYPGGLLHPGTTAYCVRAVIKTPVINSNATGLAFIREEIVDGKTTKRLSITASKSFDALGCQMPNPRPFVELIELRNKRLSANAPAPAPPPNP